MAAASGFAFDLSVLKKDGDSVDRAIAEKMERGKPAHPNPTPLGGGLEYQEYPQTREQELQTPVAMVSAWMMAVQAACIKPTHRWYAFFNTLTRMLYVFGFLLTVGIGIASLVITHWFDMDILDWFGWTVFGLFALAEILFIIVRLLGRWQYVDKPGKYEGTGFDEWVEAFVSRREFGATWQAVSVIGIQVSGSVLSLWGILVIMMQMMIDPHDTDVVHTWEFERRDEWTWLCTGIFIAVLVFLIAPATMDPTRVGELNPRGWAVLLTAWRVILICIGGPILGAAFAVYANVCCDGDWVLR